MERGVQQRSQDRVGQLQADTLTQISTHIDRQTSTQTHTQTQTQTHTDTHTHTVQTHMAEGPVHGIIECGIQCTLELGVEGWVPVVNFAHGVHICMAGSVMRQVALMRERQCDRRILTQTDTQTHTPSLTHSLTPSLTHSLPHQWAKCTAARCRRGLRGPCRSECRQCRMC